MVGFPSGNPGSFGRHMSVLINAGYPVAVYDQHDSADEKRMKTNSEKCRMLNKIYSPGSIARDNEEISAYADMRIGGQLTLLLTVSALKFSLGEDIPTTHYLNLIDLIIFITSMLLITFNLLTSIIILYWFNTGKYEQAKKWDDFLNFGSPAFLVFGLMLCVLISFN